MNLKSLQLERQVWGDMKGQITGKIEFDSPTAVIGLVITPEMSQRILAVVGDALVSVSQEAAVALKADVIQSVDHARLM